MIGNILLFLTVNVLILTTVYLILTNGDAND